MRDIINESLKELQSHKTRHVRMTAILLILSLIVSTNVFWMMRKTGITMAGDAACGIEEHTHTLECVEEIKSISSGDVSEAEHENSTECNQMQYICQKEEHIHDIECYSDENADVEAQLDWQEMFAGHVTGNLAKDLVTIAESQIGYTESERNFQIDKEGRRNGYTRYGAWYGAPYSDWSAMFVSFCLHYAGSDTANTPYNIGANSMATLWDQIGRYELASEYTPVSGNLVFFSDNTVGIVSEVQEETACIIQGDVNNAVVQTCMKLDDSLITGWGIVTRESPDMNIVAETFTSTSIYNNVVNYQLPGTGGPGIFNYLLWGSVLIIVPLVYGYILINKKRKE